jgi:hypothetical protein
MYSLTCYLTVAGVAGVSGFNVAPHILVHQGRHTLLVTVEDKARSHLPVLDGFKFMEYCFNDKTEPKVFSFPEFNKLKSSVLVRVRFPSYSKHNPMSQWPGTM